jgi:hypothetical protein
LVQIDKSSQGKTLWRTLSPATIWQVESNG